MIAGGGRTTKAGAHTSSEQVGGGEDDKREHPGRPGAVPGAGARLHGEHGQR